MPREHGAEMLVYQKPELQHNVPTRFAYSGFSVMLTNGKVAQVGASHYSVTTNRWFGSSQAQEVNTNKAASQTYNTNLTASIVIHVVSDEAFPGGRHLDTKLLPKNSYIRDQPDLVVKAIKEVTRGQEVFGAGSNDFREILAVTLTEADAKRLARLTEQSVGQRVLISVGTEPVSAPVVQIPIQTGRFTLVVQTAEDASRIFEQLRGLIPK